MKKRSQNYEGSRETYAAANAKRVMPTRHVRFAPQWNTRVLSLKRRDCDVPGIADFDTYYTTQAATLAFGEQANTRAGRWQHTVGRRYSRILRQSLCQPRFHPVPQ